MWILLALIAGFLLGKIDSVRRLNKKISLLSPQQQTDFRMLMLAADETEDAHTVRHSFQNMAP